MVTGSLQIKGIFYYIVLNMYPKGTRELKWIPTQITVSGKKNELKAQKLLSDIRVLYDKTANIENKKTAEELLQEKNKTVEKETSINNSISIENSTSTPLVLDNTQLTSEEELIIVKCLSCWYDMPKQDMITSLMKIIEENPNINLIKKIITELINKLSNDPQEQRLKKMGSYRDMLFSDYIKEWLKFVENQVTPSTYKGYYDYCNGRIIPYFENEEILLRDISLADIYNYIEYLYGEGLKANTIKHNRSILSCVLNRAVEQELLEYNFIQKLKPIKSDYYIPSFYKHEELLHLFEVVKETTISLPVILAAVYGLRREEVLGLKWDCIDFKRKTITIKHTVQRFKVNGVTQFVFKNKTKSQSSYRTLPLFDFIADLLQEYKKIYAEYRKIFGKTYNNKYKDYICLMPNGELMKPNYLTHTFAKILEDNNLKHIRLHDLRHSCATLLIQNRVPIKEIQIWLGHSNIQTTMIYTHMDESNKEISAQVLIDKFQYMIETKKNQIYEMSKDALNNIYETSTEKLNNFQKKKKLLQPSQINNN